MKTASLVVALPLALAAQYRTETVAPRVVVVHGPVNGVIVSAGVKPFAIYGDPRAKAAPVSRVLFTHHRRDVAWAGRAQVENGAEALVPAA